jgi:hypothetical protein
MMRSLDECWRKEVQMRKTVVAWALCWCLACTTDRQEPSHAPEPPPLPEAPSQDTTVVDTVMVRDTATVGESP